MILIPKRPSLVNEATNILRDSLKSGLWLDFLPGERVLSTQIRVSRQTLRAMRRRRGLPEAVPGAHALAVDGAAQ